jgi:hypothetical protein
VTERRAQLDAETAHLDDAALRLMVMMALALKPHLHAEFSALCIAGEATRAVALEILAARQVAEGLRRDGTVARERVSA